MSENDKIEIEKAQIADVSGELGEADLDKVSGGGGGYGPCPSCGGLQCACNG